MNFWEFLDKNLGIILAYVLMFSLFIILPIVLTLVLGG
jgi:hypothetical protein